MRESRRGLCRGHCSLQTAGSQAGHPLQPRGAELPGECPHSPGAAGLLGSPGALGAAASHHVLARMHTGARVHTQHPHTCTHAYTACTHMCTHSYTACTHAHMDTHSTHIYTHTQPAHTHTYARTAHTYRCTCIYDIHIYNSHTCTHSTHDATHVFCGLCFQPFGSPGASWCLRGVVRGPREPPVPGERGRPAPRLFAGLPLCWVASATRQ